MNRARFVINPNAALSQVLLRVKNGVTNYYVYGLGLLYEADDAGNTLTYHADYRGSTVALTDGTGNVTERFEYSAYGTLTHRTGNTDTPFLYNGRHGVQTDANGLLHMRARFYNPYLCRFINADPSGFGGGLNWFAFADGNPVSMMDPFGLGVMSAVTDANYWPVSLSSGPGALDLSLAMRFGPAPSSMAPLATISAPAANPFTYDALLVGSSLANTPQGLAAAQINADLYVGAMTAGVGSGGTAAITTPHITFQTGHVTQHLIDLGLPAQRIEAAIAGEIRFATQGASQTGSFWGRVSVDGKVVQYHAFTLKNGTINVGTYYPP